MKEENKDVYDNMNSKTVADMEAEMRSHSKGPKKEGKKDYKHLEFEEDTKFPAIR